MPPIIPIRPIGAYFENDKDGYVVNPASWDKIPHHWYPVIDSVKQSFIDHLDEKLHSIYLRGSLVRGTAIDQFSDLDSFAIIYEFDKYWETAFWKDELNSFISSKYNFIKELELSLTSYQDDFFKKNPRHSMILKTQSICIFGEDMTCSIPKFKPDKSMMLNYRWIASDFQKYLSDNEMSEEDYRSFLKIIIRTGYEIVMQKVGKYTPDLYFCYENFSRYFPEWESSMRKVLFCYINPSHNREEYHQTIAELCKWLIEKVKTEL